MRKNRFLKIDWKKIAFSMRKNKTELLPYMLNRQEVHMDSSIHVKDKTRKVMKENVGKYLSEMVVRKSENSHTKS